MKRTICLLAVLLAAPTVDSTSESWLDARRAMVEEVRGELVELDGAGITPAAMTAALKALGVVPRHEFVRARERDAAYENRALPIGYGQTISQPTVVALMTALLDIGAGAQVLELGTGSGYQAAVLATLGARVHSVEIVPELAEEARARLTRLGFRTLELRAGDGYFGWPEAAPFDAIIVTAASQHIPPPLIAQLKPGGRMVIPVGNPFGVQHLTLVTKDAQGRVSTRKVLPVRFVPLAGRATQPRGE